MNTSNTRQPTRYNVLIGTGGIGSGIFALLDGDHTLGREESRSGWQRENAATGTFQKAPSSDSVWIGHGNPDSDLSVLFYCLCDRRYWGRFRGVRASRSPVAYARCQRYVLRDSRYLTTSALSGPPFFA